MILNLKSFCEPIHNFCHWKCVICIFFFFFIFTNNLFPSFFVLVCIFLPELIHWRKPYKVSLVTAGITKTGCSNQRYESHIHINCMMYCVASVVIIVQIPRGETLVLNHSRPLQPVPVKDCNHCLSINFSTRNLYSFSLHVINLLTDQIVSHIHKIFLYSLLLSDVPDKKRHEVNSGQASQWNGELTPTQVTA